MALRVSEGLHARLASREQVPLLDVFILASLLSLDLFYMQLSQSISTVSEVEMRQCRHCALPAIHRMTEIEH